MHQMKRLGAHILCLVIAYASVHLAHSFGGFPSPLPVNAPMRRNSLPMALPEKSNKSIGKSSAPQVLADEAILLFQSKFSKRRKRRPIDESKLRNTFDEMCRVYGSKNSMSMVKKLPNILEMESSYFAPCYKIVEEKLGKDGTEALFLRNPGLLGTSPDGPYGADTIGQDAVFLSYIVAATRPLGPLWLAMFFGVLSIPAIEKFAGIDLRSQVVPDWILHAKVI